MRDKSQIRGSMSLQHANAANTLEEKLNTAGYAAELREAQVDGITYVRIRIEGYKTRGDANSFAGTINNQYSIKKPWQAAN